MILSSHLKVYIRDASAKFLINLDSSAYFLQSGQCDDFLNQLLI